MAASGSSSDRAAAAAAAAAAAGGGGGDDDNHHYHSDMEPLQRLARQLSSKLCFVGAAQHRLRLLTVRLDTSESCGTL